MQNVGEQDETTAEKACESLRVWRRRGCYGMTRVLPYLYVGSIRDAYDVEQLREEHIKCVLSVHGLSTRRRDLTDVDVMHIEMDDVPGANIGEHFRDAILFIHRARIQKRSVLVHCIAGVSRSVCVVAAYLIVTCDMSYATALAYIASKRPCADPNFGFRMQLAKYAQKKTQSEESLIRSHFNTEAFDELKRNDRKALLDYPAAAVTDMQDVGGDSVLCDGNGTALPSTSTKREWLDDSGCPCNVLNEPAPCTSSNSTADINFIDQ